jgi:putative glycosyltransferase (TIGR04372 family)
LYEVLGGGRFVVKSSPVDGGERSSGDVLKLLDWIDQNSLSRRHPILTPFRIVGLCLDRALGDFAGHLWGLISINAQYSNTHLVAYYHDDRPYKKAIVDCCPQIDYRIVLSSKQSFPVDYFDSTSGNPIAPRDHRWNQLGLREPSFVPTQTMMHIETIARLPRFDYMRTPEVWADEMTTALRARGLDTDAPYCCIHFREPNYGLRHSHELRDTRNPKKYDCLRRVMIDELGLQVVLIGHPESYEFSRRDGFIDLRDAEEDFRLQTFAIAHARFNILGPSGPRMLSLGFGVPTGLPDSIDFPGSVNPGDIALYQHLFGPDGQKVRMSERFERGWIGQAEMRELANHGFTTKQNESEELEELARLMHSASAAKRGKIFNEPPPNHMEWPPSGPIDPRARTVEL